MKPTAEIVRLNGAHSRRGFKSVPATGTNMIQPTDTITDQDRTQRTATNTARRARLADPQLQSGVLAYRRLQNGRIEILLVSKSRSKNWGIPKGKIKAHLSFAQNAAKEAFEEAGIRGCIQERSAGSFRILKRVLDRKVVAEVWVHLLEVTETAKKWPEMSKRLVKWCSCREAALALREPVLVELCNQLAKLEISECAPGEG